MLNILTIVNVHCCDRRSVISMDVPFESLPMDLDPSLEEAPN